MKDNFSAQADLYAQFRPSYPQELYEFILPFVKQKDIAWDCGTGNGQVASVLAKHFKHVCATDISQKQLDYATQADNVTYTISPAEQTPFADHTFDLITVGQALHWFDFERFNQEVQRVAKPSALLACWGYGLLTTSSEVDKIIAHFYWEIVGPYWDAERRHIENEYAHIPFPYQQVQSRVFEMPVQSSFEQLMGYFRTWSSVQKYIRANGNDPVEALQTALVSYWPENETKTITFPVFLKIGIVGNL